MAVYYRDDPTCLHEALKSVMEQLLLPDEVVIIQDGPLPLQLTEVITNFLQNQIVKVHLHALQKNSGLGEALRFGILKCRNEWIARMDADDISDKKRFLTQMDFVSKNDHIDVLGCTVEEFHKIPKDSGVFRKMPSLHNEIVKFSKLRSPVNHPSCIFRKSKVIAAGNYNSDNRMEDYWLFIRMLKEGFVFHNLEEPLYNFRVGDNMQAVLKRRAGLKYAIEDFRLATMANNIKYFSITDSIKYILLKVPTRLLPIPILAIIYKRFLRTRKND